MNRKFKIAGAFFGLTAVLLGAFGAHGLAKLVDVQSIASFETGVRYQMFHAFLLLLLGMGFKIKEKSSGAIFYLLIFGIVFFSGSIYLLSTQQATGWDFTSIGLLTPFGGFLLIGAWALLLYDFIKS